MASAGLTDELKDLFSSVADDLGWLNIDEAAKSFAPLALEDHEPSTVKSKPKRSKDKRTKVKKEKDDGDKKAATWKKKKFNKTADTDIQPIQKPSPIIPGTSKKDVGCSSNLLSNGIELTDTSDSSQDDILGAGAEKLQINDSVDEQNDQEKTNQQSITSPAHNIPDCSGASNSDDDVDDRKNECSPFPYKNTDDNIDGDKTCHTTTGDDITIAGTSASSSNHVTNHVTQALNDDDSDSEPEQVLTLTERLMQSHKKKHKGKKLNDFKNRGEGRQGSNNGECVVISSQSSEDEGMMNGFDEKIDEENLQTFKNYRNEGTPAKRYASDSSSDDDDNFENFLASIKSSGQTPAKPPSQDEMDDFIADDNEPIVISSDDEDQQDEVFYYQCDNAETSIFPHEEEKSNNSSIYKSLLSDSANNSDNFVTPATHLNATSKPVFKKPTNTSKAVTHSSNILSDSDSDNDEFKTPMWEPRTIKQKTGEDVTKHWNVKASNKIPIKSKPVSSMLSGLKSDESSDDGAFVTPSVRPPLKPKNFKPPSYTVPTKPIRPVLNHLDKPQQGHGIRATPSFLSSLATPVKGGHSFSPYVKEFKRNKEKLTQKLFTLYNETVFDNKLPSDLSITWNKRLRKTAGYCFYSKSKVGEKRHSRVELSDKVCDSAERLRDTLIHELCHAAAWLVNGVHDGHGRYWKYWAAKANIAHPEIPVIKRCHSYEISTKYKYQCTRCSTTIGRHSKSINTEKYCCAYCKGQLVLLPTVNKDGTPSRARTPNKFALFVKENYASAKKDNTQLKHADIMRLLSKDFGNKAKIAE